MNKSYIIGNTNVNALKLNEAETIKNNNQYYLEGVFADLSGKENRNGRIYTPEEYLPHLNYLREDIKKGDALLGELDHPEDRFEVNIKEVSHEIVDIWYVPEKKQVMGKIRLLDTPNGKIAKSLIDDGVPLHISSRSAGSVDPTSHKVDIQQIFTFDLVAKPGFAEAILHRVNESVSTKKLSNDSVTYLNNNIHNSALNVAPQFGIMNENVSIINYSQNIKLREEALKSKINTKININEMAKHILNEDEAQPLESSDNAADAMGIPTADISLDGGSDTSDNGNDNNTTEEKTDDLILGIEAVYDDENKEGDGENLILSIEASYDDEEDTEEDNEEDNEESEDSEDETFESNEDKPDPEKDALNDKLAEAKEKLNNTYTVLGKVDAFMGGIKRKNEAMESTLEKYPFSAALTESNYAKFDNLNWEQKDKVAKYINENCIMDTNSINSLWENALAPKPAEPIWLVRANEEYRSLYENASESEKNNLKYAADFMIFESQMDVDTFWENSGLKTKQEQKILNESFVNSIPKINNNVESNELPYSQDFINNIGKELERMNFK
jgi:hypothetical protein